MRKIIYLLLGLVLIISVSVLPVIGCTGDKTQNTEEFSMPVTEKTWFPLTVTDQVGRLVKIDEIPERIISLAPSNTEILFALGLGDRVVGVTQYCNYPDEAQDKTKIGGFSQTDIDVSMEQIVALEPDLIVASETHMTEVIPKMERLIPESTIIVLMNQTEEFDVIFEAISLMGKCTATTDEADQLVTEMKERIKAITDKTKDLTDSERPGVLYMVWSEPIYIIGGGTLGNALIEAAGGTNIFEELTGSPTVGLETIVDRNPDIILASASMGTGFDLPYQFAKNEPRLEGVAARTNDQIYPVDDDLTGRPGPRIVEALELMAKMIHPEIFGQVEQ